MVEREILAAVGTGDDLDASIGGLTGAPAGHGAVLADLMRRIGPSDGAG
jgi:hypothetical protein